MSAVQAVRSDGVDCSPAPVRVRVAELTGLRLVGSMTARCICVPGTPEMLMVECTTCHGSVTLPHRYDGWSIRLIRRLARVHSCVKG
jgi:hypothetical protein